MMGLEIDWLYWTERLRTYFDKVILKRGWNYFTDGAVLEISIEGTSIVKARVSGSSSYRVTIDLKSFTRSSCSCPYGSYCKHMAAVLFEVAEQEGFDPKELKNGVPKHATHPGLALAPKQAAKPTKLPTPTGTCEEWLTYFDKQYGNAKIYNAFSLEEVCMRAWGQLNKLADAWEPTIRGIYDIQVVLYLVQLCERLAGSQTDTYDFYYHADYYVMRIARHNREQLDTALHGIDTNKAQQSYPGHLKELASYLAVNMKQGTVRSKSRWLDIYKLLWSRLLFEKSLVQDETARVRELVADQRTDSQTRQAAVMGLAHFDIMNGEDENAWERAMEAGEDVTPEDWFGYLQLFVHRQEWGRLVKWLRWLGPEIRRDKAYYASDYLGFWSEAAVHIEVEKEYREAMVTLLPASYRHYSSFLLLKEEFQAWADLCLLLDLSPIHIETSDLKIVEKGDVRFLLPIYHYAAEEHIQGKNRADYKQAVKLLKKLATAYKKLKQVPRFEAYVLQLSKQYSRYRAFQEELRKGKLIL